MEALRLRALSRYSGRLTAGREALQTRQHQRSLLGRKKGLKEPGEGNGALTSPREAVFLSPQMRFQPKGPEVWPGRTPLWVACRKEVSGAPVRVRRLLQLRVAGYSVQSGSVVV